MNSATPNLESSQLISFFAEDGGTLPASKEIEQLRTWIEEVTRKQGGTLGELNYIFCGDEYLLNINRQYLQHDYFTDIITFPSAEAPQVSGDIFISQERVLDNAKTFDVPFEEELRRVIIHGVLHLCGQGDKSEEEAATMRLKEDAALELVNW